MAVTPPPLCSGASRIPSSFLLLLFPLTTLLVPIYAGGAHDSAVNQAEAFVSRSTSKHPDLITNLPGQPKASFDQFAGYVNVDAKSGKFFFYWLVEASRSAASKPLVLWLNGGPGCSSIGGGLLTEHGPWRVSGPENSTLEHNPYSWNTEANIIYAETPVGVGFSYSESNVNYYGVTDEEMAIDHYSFVQGFLQKHPRFIGRTFYIAGESYAGHYVPQLAQKIIWENSQKINVRIPLKGFLVGNAVTDIKEDVLRGPFIMYYDHGMISANTYETIFSQCEFTYDMYSPDNDYIPRGNVFCDNAIADAATEIGNIDPYDIYANVCVFSRAKSMDKTNFPKTLPTLQALKPKAAAQYSAAMQMNSSMQNRAASDPVCIDDWTWGYLNRDDVRTALHVDKNLKRSWELCSDFTTYDYKVSFPQSIVPYYKRFIKKHPWLRIWVYSGDTDSVVPFVGTLNWIASMKLPIIRPYYAWYDTDFQVGGYSEIYKGLTFATVRGAGHMVPLRQPKRALTLFRSFLANEALNRFDYDY